jgi:hypothetical protein
MMGESTTFMMDRIDEFFGDAGKTRSESHGFGRLTKNQLTGFMVGTMKGFMVNEAEFAGSTPYPGSQSEGPRRNASSRGSRLASLTPSWCTQG